MSECNSCPTKDSCDSKESCMIKNNPLNSVKKVIGVMSGKGGVGKSTISALLATQLNKKGYKVGVLDADITGPSIPRLLHVKDKKPEGLGESILPVLTDEGIEVISLNLLIENEDEPVIWRGPMISGFVEQFWTNVIWGELDYLVIDLPPGTGDVALTVMQKIPVNGMVMVSLPQDMVSMIVSKAVIMTRKVGINVVGVVENMSYIQCSDCGKKIKFYDDSNARNYMEKLNLQLLGELPMIKELTNISKNGVSKLPDNIEKTLEEMTNYIIKSV